MLSHIENLTPWRGFNVVPTELLPQHAGRIEQHFASDTRLGAGGMRILFFTSIFPRPYAPNRGVFCFRLCEGFRANGHEVRIISPRTWLERSPSKGRQTATKLPGLH